MSAAPYSRGFVSQQSQASFQLSAFSYRPSADGELTLAIYRVTAGFPRDEMYGLTSQTRRSCSSIAANLAEGCGCSGDAEFARYCSIDMGYASELEYHLLLARDLALIALAETREQPQEADG